MTDENNYLELEKRLLDVYPEAGPLVDTIKRYGGMREVSIIDTPYIELVAHGDQTPEGGPFWTLLRDDSVHYRFYVMSFGLNPVALSASFRRRCDTEGIGHTYRGEESREFLRHKIDILCQLYTSWFVEDRGLPVQDRQPRESLAKG